MILKSLRLTCFKNHPDSFYEFGDSITCILGKNGKGKTNILDAIYYLSFTKSGVGSQDRMAITHEESAFTLYGTYDELTVGIQYEKGKTKTIKFDGQEPSKLSDIIGRIPLVIILPDDTAMIKDGSEERRKFFDGALAQFDRDYLEALIRYNKLLKQRNHLLKQHNGKKVDRHLLDAYDEQLIPLSIAISTKRREMEKTFIPFLKKNYAALHAESEEPSIVFKSQIDESFEERFRSNVDKDLVMQRTLMGCHKDDFSFLLDKELIKKFGSQGQQKTFLIALKLALFDFLKEQTGIRPLLLLDDIFDKLDDSRIELLVDLLKDKERFQQIFITDARKDRSKKLFSTADAVKFIEL